MAWIHLDLWSAGYRDVDVIGPAFLLDVIAGFGLAVLLLVTTVGLFGFSETTSADLWWQSFWVELAAVVVPAVLAVLSRGRRT